MLRALAAVPDPRNPRGRRHGLQSILLLAVGAVLTGARSYAAIAQWSRCAEQEVAACGPTPHATTFGRVLAAVDPVALQYALTGWVLTRRAGHRRQHADGLQPRSEDRTVLAVDGKTLRVRPGQARRTDQAGRGPRPRPTAGTGPGQGGRRG